MLQFASDAGAARAAGREPGEVATANIEDRGAAMKIADGPQRVGCRRNPLPAPIPKLKLGPQNPPGRDRRGRASNELMGGAAAAAAGDWGGAPKEAPRKESIARPPPAGSSYY